MKKITIEIDENYATILSITAVVNKNNGANVTMGLVDLKEINTIKLDENGKMWAIREGNE